MIGEPPKLRNSTLFLLYLRQISAGLLIYQPIFIPFLLARGLTLMNVATLITAYNIGVLALDIPAGYLADRFGRKWALAIANTALTIGTILLAVGHSMPAFIAAELFYALAIAMDAGTHSAYLFDWLRRQGRETEYYRYDALGTFLFLVIGAAGTFVAGYYAEQNLLTPVLLTIGLTSIGIPAACLLPEPKRATIGSSPNFTPLSPAELRWHSYNDPPPPSSNIRPPAVFITSAPKHQALLGDNSPVFEIVREIFFTPGLRWALGLAMIWFWARQYINLYISPAYFATLDLRLRDYGMLYSILTVTSGFIALFSRRLIKRPDLRVITMVGLLTIPASFAIMGLVHDKAGLLGFFIFAIPFGLCTAVTNTLLNRQFTTHDSRATFLSVVDSFVRIAASILAQALGWVLARHGASHALVAAAVITGASALLLLPGAFRFAGGTARESAAD